jgi:hypothetical protein
MRMRTTMPLLLAALTIAGSAAAGPRPEAPLVPASCGGAGGSLLQHTAYVPAHATACCNGAARCAEYLSTMTVTRKTRAPRT